MASSRQRQRRRGKRRGTQAGTVKKPRRGPSRGGRGVAKQTGAQRREQRLNRPPSWRTAIGRALLTAGFLFAVFAVFLKRDILGAAGFAAFATLLYIPAFYFVDSFTYNRRQRMRQRREQEER